MTESRGDHQMTCTCTQSFKLNHVQLYTEILKCHQQKLAFLLTVFRRTLTDSHFYIHHCRMKYTNNVNMTVVIHGNKY